MNEKKNIERLFQEKFKDFEATPSSQVWENISAELEKKENKKRVIPFWFNMKAAGIAAAFILGMFMANNYTNLFKFNQNKNDSEIVVSTEKNQKESSKNKNETLEKNLDLKTNNTIVENHKYENPESNNNLEKSVISNKKNWIDINSNNPGSVFNKSKNENISNQNELVVCNQNKHKKVSVSKYNTNFETKKESSTTLVSTEANTKKENSNKSYFIKKKKINQTSNSNILDVINKTEIASNSENTNAKPEHAKKPVSNKVKPFLVNQPPEIFAQNNNIKSTNSSISLDEKTKDIKANSVFVNSNSLVVNTTNQNTTLSEVIVKDSTIVAVVEENPLEKILKEKENKQKEEKKIVQNIQKWKVKPNIAPLFMNATNGSPIDNQFADNAKSYENSLSVGLGIDYAVSKKLSIRTAINKFDYSYNTKDIVYYADFTAKNVNSVRNLKTINVASFAKNMIIEDKNVSKSQEIAIQTKEDGLLNQKTGYLEIPVEVSYKLLDKKFGIQVITGLSSLLLNKNQVSLISSEHTTVIGEATNLNKVHFSTNIGLGFKYSFWKSFEANFEPTFKYQLNTYNANSGGFKPYLLGLYSGISFNF